MQRWTYTVLARGTGLALNGALVTIYETGTTTKATLYETDDVSGPEKANPLEADAFGEIWAYVPDGVYDLRVDHNANPTRTIPEVQIFDLEALEIVASGELAVPLQALAALSIGNNRLPYFTSTTAAALTDFTNVARQLLDDTTFAAMRTTLGIDTAIGDYLAANNYVIGTDVQAWDEFLDSISTLTDPNADKLLGWDDSAGEFAWFDLAGTIPTEATASEILIGSETGKYVSPDKFRTATAPATLADAATIAVDFEAGRNFTVTLTDNRTLGNPTNVQAGDSGTIYVVQDGTGSRTLALDTNWKAIGAAPTLSTAPGAVDVFAYFARATDAITLSYLGAEV